MVFWVRTRSIRPISVISGRIELPYLGKSLGKARCRFVDGLFSLLFGAWGPAFLGSLGLVAPCQVSVSGPEGVQHLEFLAEVGGMEQLHEAQLPLAEARGLDGRRVRDELARMMDKKRLL